MSGHAKTNDPNFTRYMVPTPGMFIGMYEEEATRRYPGIDAEQVNVNATILSVRASRDPQDALFLLNMLRSYADSARGPGTRAWHFLVERLSTRELVDFRRATVPDWAIARRTGQQFDMRSTKDVIVHQGIVAEEARRRDALVARRGRSDLAQSDFARKAPYYIDPDSLGLVGQFASARITARPIPGVRASGPLPSNTEVLERITAEAAHAAMHEPAEVQVETLARVASQLKDLVESVSKKQRQ